MAYDYNDGDEPSKFDKLRNWLKDSTNLSPEVTDAGKQLQKEQFSPEAFSNVGQKMDAVTGAPFRAAAQSIQQDPNITDVTGALGRASAAAKQQFGKDPNQAPTWDKMLGNAGMAPGAGRQVAGAFLGLGEPHFPMSGAGGGVAGTIGKVEQKEPGMVEALRKEVQNGNPDKLPVLKGSSGGSFKPTEKMSVLEDNYFNRNPGEEPKFSNLRDLILKSRSNPQAAKVLPIPSSAASAAAAPIAEAAQSLENTAPKVMDLARAKTLDELKSFEDRINNATGYDRTNLLNAFSMKKNQLIDKMQRR